MSLALHDSLLATFHHAAAFSLVALLFAEGMLLRLAPTQQTVVQLARIDLAYGATAGLLLVAGIARVIQGGKGSAFYMDNTIFWAKMTTFAVVALISIRPTMAFLKWARGVRQSHVMPNATEWTRIRTWVHAELALIPLLLMLAAMLGRGMR